MYLRKSKITCVFDFFLYLLIISITILIAYILWKRVHRLLAIILSYPIYRIIGHLIIFLTAPLYYWLTPDNKAWSIYCDAVFDGDDDTASRLGEVIDSWNEGGDCVDLQESCKRVKDSKSILLNEDSDEESSFI